MFIIKELRFIIGILYLQLLKFSLLYILYFIILFFYFFIVKLKTDIENHIKQMYNLANYEVNTFATTT